MRVWLIRPANRWTIEVVAISGKGRSDISIDRSLLLLESLPLLFLSDLTSSVARDMVRPLSNSSGISRVFSVLQGVTIETIAPGDGKNFPKKGGTRAFEPLAD